ncbi:MAG: bifunctional UDP-N-acetylglucosamine diphosphorylase/glucosamine-1-phosphate N-acetyltransferase GlmU [Calothrix sp. SM1_5_4]|nr:bifunctional UDP-N-acetylglucosamine diphosphorylase/glucosamine-1-phosphate N-acetyltransferase GlmU [Calothrix sp. SM1_5_4]
MSAFSAIVLAAGKGTRMNSPLPKVVHPVCGRPMIERVIRAVQAAKAVEVRVVVGFGEKLVRQIAEPLGAVCFKQERQLGTADAVRSARPDDLEGDVVILNGDHPLMEAADIEKFRREFHEGKADVAVVTCELDDPGSFGRVVRQKDKVMAIVEMKDASHETRKIKEVNTGIYVIRADVLNDLLPRIQSHNAQGEFYLTDLIGLAVEDGLNVQGLKADPRVALGVNTQGELALATAQAFRRKADRLMEAGVIVVRPDQVFIEESVEVAAAAVLYPNVFLRGATRIGAFTVIEPGCVLSDAVIGGNVHVKAGCYIDHASVGDGVKMGPYAHLRPGTEVGDECHVGNFVEMKKVKFGRGAKANHLTYLGDAEIGENTNIGCGTITCNYAVDRKKYVTKIGKDVFVGSDSQFIAPVTVGDGAVIGSGSTITKDVPAGALAVGRARQIVKENYVPNQGSKKKKED